MVNGLELVQTFWSRLLCYLFCWNNLSARVVEEEEMLLQCVNVFIGQCFYHNKSPFHRVSVIYTEALYCKLLSSGHPFLVDTWPPSTPHLIHQPPNRYIANRVWNHRRTRDKCYYRYKNKISSSLNRLKGCRIQIFTFAAQVKLSAWYPETQWIDGGR